MRWQGFLFCRNLWLSQFVTVQNTTCQIDAKCARSSIAQSVCQRAFSLLAILCQRPWVWTFIQQRKTTCLLSNRKSFAVDLHNTHTLLDEKMQICNCVISIYLECSYLLVIIKTNYHFIVLWQLFVLPISCILCHIVQHNLTYSLNNNALWWTMGYFCPVHDHVVEGKGVHQNCLLYTLFIKWTIELSGIGHHLFPIWVASASMTAILSCGVQPHWEGPVVFSCLGSFWLGSKTTLSYQ